MNSLFVRKNQSATCFGGCTLISIWSLLLCCSLGAWAQSRAVSLGESVPFSIRATHLMGLENTKSNSTGILSIQDNALQFQLGSKPGTEVKIASIQGAFLGSESKQVGGLPLKLGKTAAPYGGGRVLSLFTHKKYDTLTLEYLDGTGGVHGAIFQLNKGQGEVVMDELLSHGARISGANHPTKQSTAEVRYEDK